MWHTDHVQNRDGASVLARAFQLLDVFADNRTTVGLAELARAACLPKATAYRIAGQLVNLEILERSGNRYRLGLRLFEIGTRVTSPRRLREAALPYMEDLYESTHETVHLGIREGTEVLYIERIAARLAPRVATAIGTRKPLYCTGLGKALLAYSNREIVTMAIEAGLRPRTPHTLITAPQLRLALRQIVKTGIAYDREEYALGVTCVASAIIDSRGQPVAALSIAGPTTRFDPDRTAAAVRTAALSVSRTMGPQLAGLGSREPTRATSL